MWKKRSRLCTARLAVGAFPCPQLGKEEKIRAISVKKENAGMVRNSSKDSLAISLQSCRGQFLPRLGSGDASQTQR